MTYYICSNGSISTTAACGVNIALNGTSYGAGVTTSQLPVGVQDIMASYFKGPRLTRNETGGRTLRPISFALKHSNSDAFKTLFKEGMALVETTAAYLDGKGRADSKALLRPIALAYATESMRLTTRLMQIASWLLLRRAVNEGELTLAQAMSERHRVRLQRQDLISPPEVVAELPPAFVEFCIRSIRLQKEMSSSAAPGRRMTW